MTADNRAVFSAFLSMHSNKASATATRVAHARFYAPDQMGADSPLLLMDLDDLKGQLDTNERCVQWVLEQLMTYDNERQKLMVLIFDRKTVLSEVLWAQTRESDWCEDELRCLEESDTLRHEAARHVV